MSGAPGAITAVQHRVELLERQLRHQREQLDKLIDLRSALAATPQQVRLVRTYASTPESYPTPPANTFDVRFLDTALDVWSPGNRTPTFSARSESRQTTASTYDGRFILPDKDCVAALLNEHWWIVDGPGLHYHGRLLAALSKDGSASMEIIEWNGTKYIRTGFTVTVYDRYLNTGKTLADRTKVDVRLEYPGRYDVVNAYCAADDNEDSVYDEEEETPP